MKRYIGLAIAIAIMLAFSAFPPGVRAESDEYADPGSDEGIPAWSVARLNVIDGTAWVLPPGESDWQEYEGNAPLSKGARVRVAEGSSADIGFGGNNLARLAEGTDIEIRDLREERTSLRLYEGTATFRLPGDDFFTPVNTTLPDGQVVRFAKPGRYSIEVAGQGEESVVKVRDGEAGVKIGQNKYRVRAGEEASVGDEIVIGRLADDGSFENEPPPPELTPAESAVEAPPTVVYELRDYGDWVNAPAYGVVWRPRVAVGWSPYYFGRWVWTASFGWSWVSDEPWGWYPYRCGNWFNDPILGWCWTPYGSFVSVSWTSGHRYYRPRHFFPATVRFVREGGNVRWVPLRPGERFTRPAVPRNDRVLTSWRQPLTRQTVFARDPARRGGETPQWRDAHVDRPARQPAARPAPVVRPTPTFRATPGDSPSRIRQTPAPRREPGAATRAVPAIRPRPTAEPGVRSDERRRGPAAPPVIRERPEAPFAPPRETRPDIRTAPERTAPGVESAPRRLQPEERRVPEPRDDMRGRDGGGGGDAPRGDRGGRGVR